MGATCQKQFQNVPDLQFDTTDYQREKQRISISSIKQQHRTIRPISKQFNFGMIDTKLNTVPNSNINNVYNSTYVIGDNGQLTISPNKNSNSRSKIFTQNKNNMNKIDMQQLHVSQRPFVGTQTVAIPKNTKMITKVQTKNRQQLDLNFYHSLALPQYTYRDIPAQYRQQYENLIVCEQQQRNGVKYIGEWKDVKTIHGNGVLKSNTTKYIGQFRNGLKHLHGRQIEKYQVYQGQFQNGRRKGKGMRYTPESMQQGVFDNYLQKGIIKYQNGNVYEGELKHNVYNGQGTFYDAKSQTLHRGIYRNGKLNGHGQILLRDRIIYDGQFVEGLKHGQGNFNWDQNNYYRGEYRKGKKHGHGELVKGNTMYEGQFLNGNMSGNMNVYDLSNGGRNLKNTAYYENGILVRGDQQSQVLTERDGMPRQWREVTERKNQILDISEKDLDSSFHQLGGPKPIVQIPSPSQILRQNTSQDNNFNSRQLINQAQQKIPPQRQTILSDNQINIFDRPSQKFVVIPQPINQQSPMIVVPPSLPQTINRPPSKPLQVIVPNPSIKNSGSNLRSNSQLTQQNSKLTTRNNLYKPLDNNYEGQLQNSVQSTDIKKQKQPHYGDMDNPQFPSKIGNIAGSKIMQKNVKEAPLYDYDFGPNLPTNVTYTKPNTSNLQNINVNNNNNLSNQNNSINYNINNNINTQAPFILQNPSLSLNQSNRILGNQFNYQTPNPNTKLGLQQSNSFTINDPNATINNKNSANDFTLL